MKKKLKHNHSTGNIDTLFPAECVTCHYKTRHEQCAWFEFISRRDLILEAKRAGATSCPQWKKKESLNNIFLIRKELERAMGIVIIPFKKGRNKNNE